MKPFRNIELQKNQLFAIGDIHGCPRELKILLHFLKTERALSSDDVIVFMGDYIDRGPDTCEVLQTLLEFQKEFPASVFLRGNHEDMFMHFLGFEGSQGDVYLMNGGSHTLKSYGIPVTKEPQEVLNDLPNSHLAFLLGLDSCVRIGDYVFAHAGLNPLKKLGEQSGADLFWIRDKFITKPHNFGATVIFGHTPYQNVLFDLPYKIGIDTGLVYENRLSCVDLRGSCIIQVCFGTSRALLVPFPIIDNSSLV